MRGFSSALLLLFALSGCGLPAPYQTYSPGAVTLPPLPSNALVVYGATTTSREMVPDAAEIEPVPATPAQPAATGQSSPSVAICYNRLWDGADAVKSAAAQACGNANSSPRVTTQGVDLDACPILTPTKAVFACPTPSASR